MQWLVDTVHPSFKRVLRVSKSFNNQNREVVN